MRKVQASEAKTHLTRLLDEVEQGERITITRHGRAIAELVPARRSEKAKVAEALASIRALRETTKGMTAAEILSARDEGRK